MSWIIIAGVVVAAITLLMWAFALSIGLHWTKTPDVTTRRIVKATSLAFVGQLAVSVLFAWWFAWLARTSLVALAALAVLYIVVLASVGCLSIHYSLKTGLLRSIQAWLPTLVPLVGMFLFALTLVRPLFYEAFKASTNSMAPTILGLHCRSECPACGAVSFGSPVDQGNGAYPQSMICENFHVTEQSQSTNLVYRGDRILVEKFSKPQRWDLVAFRVPYDPTTVFVMRLVGLPGESIHLEDGAVWVDGQQLTPPPSLEGIEYVTEFEFFAHELWGSKQRPARLGEDEYFVLGDFSEKALDSRMWQSGAEGHSPYAVPGDHIIGPVRYLYWPPQRWRDFR